MATSSLACLQRVEIGELEEQAAPAPPLDLERFTTPIYASSFATCALTSIGGVACWGSNGDGELGLNDHDAVTFSQTPVTPVGFDSGTHAVFGGEASHCAMRDTGRVECWGYMFLGILDGYPFVAYSLGPTTMDVVGDDTVQIAVGWEMYCLLTRTGQAKCWGVGNSGQLGNGTSEDTVEPHDVADIAGERYVELTIGARHTCSVTTTGSVMCWGRNPRGELGALGPDQLLPTPVAIDDVRSIAAGRAHTCALKADGSVWCWGDNHWGQLGAGPGPEPVAIPGLPRVTAIAARGDQSCALASDGAVWCWGDMQSNSNPTPPAVMLDASFGATAIACGWRHACAMNTARVVRCWGDNTYGQTGGGEIAL